jgi:hypothetical protein
MRRSIVILLLLLLPLHWSATAVAVVVCMQNSVQDSALDNAAAVYGEMTDDCADSGAGESKKAHDAGHDHCHGQHVILVASRFIALAPERSGDSPYLSTFSEPPPDDLLRPPATPPLR